VLILVGLAMAALPMAVAALGLDVEGKGGAGIGLGSTNNSSETGSPWLAGGGGIGVDVFVFNVGPIDLGLSAGVEYSYLSQHEKISNYAGPGLDFTGTPQYNFVYIPFALVGSLPLGQVRLVLHAGGFAGYFLSGKVTDISITVLGSQPDSTLNGSTTPQWEFGLHFALGADIPIMKDVSVSPAIQFDWGLSNIDTAVGATEYDTVGSLAVMVSIKYKAL